MLAATVGARREVPTVIFHGHLDVVPGQPEQYSPRIEGDRMYGRGAYDMKGGLAGMMCAVVDLADQQDTRIHFLCVSDEESDEADQRGSDHLVEQGYVGDFAITGEPTDLHVGRGGEGRAGDAHRGDRHRRPRLHAVGRATTPCSRPSTSSG